MVAPNTIQSRPVQTQSSEQLAISAIADALARIRFGDIRITIHEGRLVQIDVTEKTRFQGN